MKTPTLKQTLVLITQYKQLLWQMPLFALAFIIATNSSMQAAPKVTPGNVYEIKEVKLASKNQMTDFIFLDDEGKEYTLREYTLGKYVFLNFWGTWCPPCRAEIPAIIELQKELQSNLVMIGVALERDRGQNIKQGVADFAAKQGINYINFIGSQEVLGKLTTTYGGISAVPTTYLVNKDNTIFEKITGGLTKAKFQESLNKMMK